MGMLLAVLITAAAFGGHAAIRSTTRALVLRKLGEFPAFPVARTWERIMVAEAARPFRGATDSTISAADAGRAYHALLVWKAARPILAPVTDSTESPWGAAFPDDNPLGIPPARWSQDLLPAAARGLTPAQLAFLRHVAGGPRATTFAPLETAAAIDVLGTRYVADLESDRDPYAFWNTPIPDLSPFRRALQSRYAHAALCFAAADTAGAETALRGAINASLLVMDHGPTVIETNIGARGAWSSLLALASFYTVSGRAAEAARIRRAVNAAASRVPPPPLDRERPVIREAADILAAVLERADVPVGIKLEYLQSAQMLTLARYCTGGDPFGSDHAARRAKIRGVLARTPGEQRYVDWVTHPPATRAGCTDELPPQGNIEETAA